jgi:DNA-binding NtrC family response regulator
LRALAEAGSFREDLFFRLNVLDIAVPPLRRRREDIPALIAHFIARDARRPLQLAPDALDALIRYDYPGNVRELEHIIQRSLTLTRGNRLQPSDLPAEVRRSPAPEQGLLQERLDTLERDLLRVALENAEWIQTRAADQLGISERVLRYKMGKYGLRR